MVSSENRAFLYGDGFFETCMGTESHIYLWKFHAERIENAAKVFGLELLQNTSEILAIIQELVVKNSLQNFKAKIIFYREDGGLYLPKNNKAEIAIFVYSKEENIFEIPTEIAKTAIFQTPLKICNRFSAFKTLSSLPYVMASKWANENGFSDAIILNQNMRLAEFTSSNIFLYNDDKLVTPASDEGPILGVMRRLILENKTQFVIQILEKKISSNEVFRHPFLLSTNANGIKVLSLHNQTEIPQKLMTFIQQVKELYLTN